MATYGNIFEFIFDSQAGAEVKILISKKSYTGAVTRRALGSAPKLKRQNNGHIYGTSLEIYAECLVDGEFAQLYTTSAYEYRVELYKNGSRLWVGHVTPELYSEPDIAPPYDVQIVATDGLGELKNYDFQSNGWNTLYQHINGLLNISGLSLAYDIVSNLFYVDGNGNHPNSPSSVLNVSVDLSHKDGESCYNVLQGLLESLNAGITQHNGRWMIFRETDFIGLASANGLDSYDLNGNKSTLPVVQFGSSASFQWWPVGQLNTVIEPAKKSVTVEAPNHYRGNVFAKTWSTSMGASYDETEGAYILPDNGSKISQRIEFDAEVGYRLGLRVSARNIGSGGEDQDLAIKVKVDAVVGSRNLIYYLLQQKSSDRGPGAYYWDTSEGFISADLALPNDSDTADDAQDVDIIIPLYGKGQLFATAVEVTLYNPAGRHDIAVYDVSLSKYDQFAGYKDDVIIDNGAREASDTMEASFAQTANLPVASEVFMTGVPMLSSGYVIESWKRGSDEASDYLSVISKDYATAVASPRMRYQGVLFVPKSASLVPTLFLRDNTYYFPKTYSYDLFSDEMDIELLSIPSSEVTIGSSVIGSMSSPSTGGGASSSSGAGIGGGGASSTPDQEMSDSSANAVQNKVIKKYVDDVFAPIGKWFSEISPMFGKMADGILKVSGNLVVTGDTSSGGGAGGGETQITGFLNDLNDVTIKSQVAGDLLIFNGSEWVNTPQSSIVPNLSGYATEAWVLNKNYISDITATMVTTALGYTPYNSADFTKANIKSTLGISDWALTASKPSYKSSEVTEETNLYFTNARAVAAVLGSSAIGGTSAYIYWTGSSWASKTLGSLAFSNGLSKADVGLSNVDNTADSSKRVASAMKIVTDSNADRITADASAVYSHQSLLPIYHNSYALGSLTKSWMSLFLISSNNRSTGADPIVINDSRSSAGYQAIRFMRNGADYAALQWFHDGFNNSAYAWNKVSCLNLDTAAGGSVTIGAWSDPTLIVWKDSKSIDARGAMNISGNLSATSYDGGVNSGTGANTSGKFRWGSFDENGGLKLQFGASTGAKYEIINSAWNKALFSVTTEGDCTIGRNLLVTGEVASASDMRLKDVIEDRVLNVEDIAKAPYFSYRWKNSEYGLAHLGTSAQYWKEIASEYVVDGDIMTLNYASLGVGIGISLAKVAVDHEERIKTLEKENERLKKQINGIR